MLDKIVNILFGVLILVIVVMLITAAFNYKENRAINTLARQCVIDNPTYNEAYCRDWARKQYEEQQ
jgi:hypothetical protein